MEIRQLKYFLKIAETLNFSEASRRLYITQSTLSQQISHLEQEIGLALFERNSHEVFLTDAGKELLPYAQRVIVASDSCIDHIADLKDMLTGELNIGVTFSFSTIMAETMMEFMHDYPGVKLNIYYRTMEELMQMLKRREIDFALAFRPLKKDKNIRSETIFTNSLAAIVREHHPLTQKKSVSLKELQQFQLLLPSRGLQARNAFDQLIAEKDYEYNIRVEVDNVDILLELLQRSHYVTVLSRTTALHTKHLRAIPIVSAENTMEGCIHTLKDAYCKNATHEFRRILSQNIAMTVARLMEDIHR